MSNQNSVTYTEISIRIVNAALAVDDADKAHQLRVEISKSPSGTFRRNRLPEQIAVPDFMKTPVCPAALRTKVK